MDKFSFINILNWYWFLISRRTLDFLIFMLVIFVFPILPYAIVAFKLMNQSDEHLRIFYGDGTIMILCSGILCSFVAMLFEHKSEEGKKLNLFINISLTIIFIILTIIFVDSQLNFFRDWCYIQNIIIVTSVTIIITILAALYLNFRVKINYADVEQFVEEVKRKRIDRKAKKSKQSKGGTKV